MHIHEADPHNEEIKRLKDLQDKLEDDIPVALLDLRQLEDEQAEKKQELAEVQNDMTVLEGHLEVYFVLLYYRTRPLLRPWAYN